MHGSTAVVSEIFSVNKWAYGKILKDIICPFGFSNYIFGFHTFHLKKVKNNSICFFIWCTEEI